MTYSIKTYKIQYNVCMTKHFDDTRYYWSKLLSLIGGSQSDFGVSRASEFGYIVLSMPTA